MAHGERLPGCCAKCGEAPTRERTLKVSYIPWWAFVLFVVLAIVGTAIGIAMGLGPVGFGGAVLAVFALAATRRSASLVIPLCPACEHRWEGGELRRGLAAATFFLLFFVVPMLLLDRKLARPRMVWARRIDEGGITLVGVHPDVARGTGQRSACAGKRRKRRQGPGP